MIRKTSTAALVLLTASAAQADVTHLWSMSDHPDGNQAPAYYGLRLDNLFGNGDVVTFSLDHHADSQLTVTEHDNGSLSIRMEGTLYGGVDGGAAPIDPESYRFVWEYTEGVVATADGYVVMGQHEANGGYIESLDGEFRVDYGTKLSGDIAFEFEADGHRLAGDSESWVGRGWHMRDGGSMQGNRDWLFQADYQGVIPTPGTMALGIMGAGLVGVRRRR